MSLHFDRLLCGIYIYVLTFAIPPLLTGNVPEITRQDLNDSISFANQVIGFMKRLEVNIVGSRIGVDLGTPSHGRFISDGPETEAVLRGREGWIAVKATAQLINKFCLGFPKNFENCLKMVMDLDLENTALQSSCDRLKKICSPKEYLYMYRSANGACNHVPNGAVGQSFTGYSRLLPAEYLDSSYAMRRAVNKKPLPSARLVTGLLVSNTETLDDYLTLAAAEWGQFVAQDLSRVATSIMVHSNDAIECCGRDGSNLLPRHRHPFCAPISVPSNDKYFSNYDIQCMSYVRSMPSVQTNCGLGPSNQLNQATHYLDGSQIYGSSFEKTNRLRSFVKGKLDVSGKEKKTVLPFSHNPTKDCLNGSICFSSGDPRVNLEPQMTVLYTLWLREHNRIAEELASLNRQWDDEKIFQEARRIVVAEIQHITYNEWMSKVLANKYVEYVQEDDKYDENADPSVSNSFASVAIDALKSSFSGQISLVTEDRNNESFINLHEHFYKPEIIMKPGAFDSLVRGLATQRSQKVDMHFPDDLINNYLSNVRYGDDLLALAIQRGRDHGLSGYADFKTLCELKPVKNFEDLQGIISEKHIEGLKGIYSHLKDVDLIIGVLMEYPEKNSALGPTLSCLIAEQLLRTKNGDRLFYTNKGQPKPFTDLQMKEIQKVTLARIFCDNSDDVKQMQPNVFEKISERNSLVSCNGNSIPRMSLIPWLETSQQYEVNAL